MWKFIKRLFTKKKRYVLDDFDLSMRLILKFHPTKKGHFYLVYFYHPLTGKLSAMPDRKVAHYSKWSILKQGYMNKEDQMIVCPWTGEERDVRNKFKRVNDLRIYFESLERKYNELHP